MGGQLWASVLCEWAGVPLGTVGSNRGLVDMPHLPTLAVYNLPEKSSQRVIGLTIRLVMKNRLHFKIVCWKGESKYLKYVSMNVLKTLYPF